VNEQYFRRNYVIHEKDITFHDVREAPFGLYGLYQPQQEAVFKRLPDSVAEATSERVSQLYKNTSGGRVRFVTDSSCIAIKAKMPYIAHRSIMSLLCTAGFDLYVRQNNTEIYRTSFRPPIDMEDGFENIIHFKDASLREITIYFPLYNDVDSLEIGVRDGAALLQHADYAIPDPVVYYGSSITQGANASRPGMSYEAMISRRLDCDFINLGFAGSARGETAMAEYISTLRCSAFVCDYDHNAPTAEHLRNTHEKLYRTVREKQKTIPILLLSRPTGSSASADDHERRSIVFSTYHNARSSGDDNVHFVDGFSLFGAADSDDCFADGVHPNDLGLYRMSELIGKTLRIALMKK
jgi:hypothetical protein